MPDADCPTLAIVDKVPADFATELEMPVPEANPRPERPEGSPCLELPPQIEASE